MNEVICHADEFKDKILKARSKYQQSLCRTLQDVLKVYRNKNNEDNLDNPGEKNKLVGLILPDIEPYLQLKN